jgi:hypothetical protein
MGQIEETLDVVSIKGQSTDHGRYVLGGKRVHEPVDLGVRPGMGRLVRQVK